MKDTVREGKEKKLNCYYSRSRINQKACDVSEIWICQVAKQFIMRLIKFLVIVTH